MEKLVGWRNKLEPFSEVRPCAGTGGTPPEVFLFSLDRHPQFSPPGACARRVSDELSVEHAVPVPDREFLITVIFRDHCLVDPVSRLLEPGGE